MQTLCAVFILLVLPSFPAAAHAAERAVTFHLGPDYVEAVDSTASSQTAPARLSLSGPLHDLVFIEDRLYVARGRMGVTVIDVADPQSPVELLHFGSGPEAVKLAVRGMSLVVTHADGSAAAYDISRLDVPRRLSAHLSWPLSPPPRKSPHDHPEQSAHSLIATGRVVLIVGAVLTAFSGLFFYAADAAVRAAHDKTLMQQQYCREHNQHFCFAGLGEILAGFSESIAAYTFLGLGVTQLAIGIPILGVGEYRRRRLELRPGLLPLVSPPSASQGAGPVTSSGLRLAVTF